MTSLGGYEVWVDPAGGGNGGGADWQAGAEWFFGAGPPEADSVAATAIAQGMYLSITPTVGEIVGVAYYRTAGDTLPSRTVYLQDPAGLVLHSVTIPAPAAEGWARAPLPAPVPCPSPPDDFWIMLDCPANAHYGTTWTAPVPASPNIGFIAASSGGDAPGAPPVAGGAYGRWVDLAFKPSAARSAPAKAAKSTKKAAKKA